MVESNDYPHVFPFDPCRPMSPRMAYERVDELNPRQLTALMIFYGAAAQSQGRRLMCRISDLIPMSEDDGTKLRAAAHYNNLAIALHVQDLRATFGPDTDPAVIAAVNKIGALVKSMRSAIDPLLKIPQPAANATDKEIETFLDSEASGA